MKFYWNIIKIFLFQDCAEARKNTLLYHFNSMNVVKRIQSILKSKEPNNNEDANSEQLEFTSQEIHKVHLLKIIYH